MKFFNKDINGLRAIAVLSVLLFHFAVPGFNGGFVGVDIFFVISGFLMTKIIFSRLEDNSFSILDFYMERARRIIPALAGICIFLLIMGWFVLNPSDYEILGKHVLGSMTFVSNIMYWQEAGYFDVSSHEKFLLHSWSLSIEWQFYILYPLLIIIITKFSNIKWTKVTLIIISFVSLGISVFSSEIWPNASFYLLHTRSWEMLAGGLLYLYPLKFPKSINAYIQMMGMILIILSIFLISPDSSWPGWLAIIPVLGAMMVINSSSNQSFILTNGFFQWIGKISYSIYLWHWPLVVYLYYQNKSGDAFWIISGFILSIILGGISYQIIEKPSHKLKLYPLNYRHLFFVAAFLFIIVVGAYTYISKGFPQRFQILQVTQKELNKEWDIYAKKFAENYNFRKRKLEDKQGTTLIVGSSHARDLANAFIENGYQNMTSFRSAVCGNFSNMPNLTDKKECARLNKILLTEISNTSYSRIFLHDHWPNVDKVNLKEMLLKIREKTDIPIYVFGPKMTYKEPPLRIIHNGISSGLATHRQLNLFAKSYQGSSKQTHIKNPRIPINNDLISFFSNDIWTKNKVYYVDIMSIQCGEKMDCQIISENDLKPLYFDDNHWTLQGAREFGSRLKEDYPELFTSNSSHP